MLISPALAKAFNEQIGHEFGASMQYLSIAHILSACVDTHGEAVQDKAEEEKQHAMKFVKYLQDTNGGLQIPPIRRRSRDVCIGR